jgi:hypothetical protein
MASADAEASAKLHPERLCAMHSGIVYGLRGRAAEAGRAVMEKSRLEVGAIN